MNIKRISFSELKNWKECPYRHKLIYIDQLEHFEGNEYTAFGSAIHEVCEKIIPGTPESGTGITISAISSVSFANCFPRFFLNS